MSANTELRLVTDHASETDWSALMTAVRTAAFYNAEFSTDAVWNHVVDFHGEPRLMGAVIRQATQDGLIQKKACLHCGSDAFEKSDREAANSNPKRIYKSLIFGGGYVDTRPVGAEAWD